MAQYLGVHAHEVALWTAAKAFPPQEIFEKVLEIILDAYENKLTQGGPASAALPSQDVSASAKPRALLAESPTAVAVISNILGDALDVIAVSTESEALDILQGSAMVAGRGIDVIICGQHFEGSQMLDFLQCVKAYKPTSRIPFICCRVLPTHLSENMLAAMRDTCEALGALAYIDLIGTEKRQGADAAVVQFRDAVGAAVRLPKTAQALRVLVVDDNADAAHTLTALLRMAGHNVQKAASGAEALRIAQEFRPAVVVLDVAMPQMSGYAVAERLRAAPWGRELTLIAVTGHGTPEDLARAKQAGFDHHFVKPVTLQQLLAAFPAPPSPPPAGQ